MKKKELNIAIVGCGRIGSRHAGHIRKTANLVAVCDIDEEKSNKLAQEIGCKSFQSVEQLVNSNLAIDLVAICSPNGLHAVHSITCLRNGYHVLCEKPMALTLEDCGKMIDTAEKYNRRLFIVKQNRFNPPVVKLKEILENKSLGQVFSIQLNCFWNRTDEYYTSSDWKGTLDLDGGTLFTQFSHFLDLLIYLFGEVRSIDGYIDNFNHKGVIQFEDTGVIILKFKSGVLGTVNYTVNSYDQNMEGSLTVFGSKGTIKIGGQYLNEIDYQRIESLEISNLEKGNPANSYGKYFGSMSNHDKIYENVIDVLQNGAAISTNAYEGLRTVDLIERIYEKVRD